MGMQVAATEGRLKNLESLGPVSYYGLDRYLLLKISLRFAKE